MATFVKKVEQVTNPKYTKYGYTSLGMLLKDGEVYTWGYHKNEEDAVSNMDAAIATYYANAKPHCHVCGCDVVADDQGCCSPCADYQYQEYLDSDEGEISEAELIASYCRGRSCV